MPNKPNFNQREVGQLLLQFGSDRKLMIAAFNTNIKPNWFERVKVAQGRPDLIADKLDEIIKRDEYTLKLIVANLKRLKHISSKIRKHAP